MVCTQGVHYGRNVANLDVHLCFIHYYGFKKHILGVHRDCVASGTAENVGSGINVPVSDALSEDPPVTFQTPVENRQLCVVLLLLKYKQLESLKILFNV